MLYGVSRLVGALFIARAAPGQVPVGQLPEGYKSTVPHGSPAGYGDVVTNWDGQWYWDIVLRGYPGSAVGAAGEPVQTSLAFYPLYPTLVRALTDATGLGFAVVAPTLSLVLGAGAFLVLFPLLRDVVGRTRALLALAALTCFVSAPILQTAYTESLALLLVAAALLLLRRRRYVWVAVPVVLLGLTRNITVALAPVIVLHWVAMRRGARPVETVRHRSLAALLAVCLLATALWPLLAGLLTGEMDAYLTTLKAWPGFTGSVFEPPWVAEVTRVGALGWLFAGAVALGWALLFCSRQVRRWGPELAGWGAVYPVYIVLTTGATLSLLRYLLLAFPLALLLVPEVRTRGRAVARAVLVAAACALGLLAQWWWVSTVLVVHARPGGFIFP